MWDSTPVTGEEGWLWLVPTISRFQPKSGRQEHLLFLSRDQNFSTDQAAQQHQHSLLDVEDV